MNTAPPVRRPLDLWPVAALVLVVAVVVLPVAAGRPGAGLVAAVQIAGIGFGIVYGAYRIRRADGDDAQQQLSWPEAAMAVITGAGATWVGLAVFFAVLYLAGVSPRGEGRLGFDGLQEVVAAALALLLAFHMVSTVRVLWGREGVERQVFLEATSTAIFVTLVAAAAYGLFEFLAGAPPLSMWWLWTFGMVAWGAISAYRMRQFR